MRVLFDTDVLLDVLLQREPFADNSVQALDTVMDSDVEGFVAGHAVTTLAYLVRRTHSQGQVRSMLATLLARITVAPVTAEAVRLALVSPIGDFDDAVGHACALEQGVDVIVTRNIADYVSGTILALAPEAFLASRITTDEVD